MSDDGTESALPVPASQQSGELTAVEAGQVYAQVVRTQERYKTARTAIIAGTVLGGVYIVSTSLASILNQPAWLQAVAIICGGGAPSYAIWRMCGKFRFYMQHDHQRVIEVEAAVDVRRESSNVKPDGTSLHD